MLCTSSRTGKLGVRQSVLVRTAMASTGTLKLAHVINMNLLQPSQISVHSSYTISPSSPAERPVPVAAPREKGASFAVVKPTTDP
jgi:hypothetical protein|eukprot:COSAG03_NODE_3068_length_2250_cov_1.757787_2_plen_85_part_00